MLPIIALAWHSNLVLHLEWEEEGEKILERLLHSQCFPLHLGVSTSTGRQWVSAPGFPSLANSWLRPHFCSKRNKWLTAVKLPPVEIFQDRFLSYFQQQKGELSTTKRKIQINGDVRCPHCWKQLINSWFSFRILAVRPGLYMIDQLTIQSSSQPVNQVNYHPVNQSSKSTKSTDQKYQASTRCVSGCTGQKTNLE